ncbi:MAG TPA: RluA family pseudouridine synthase [Methylomirabilota bacterium]|nr:RluA family pseudouridine synthase [Methylomirabilota bacterium]
MTHRQVFVDGAEAGTRLDLFLTRHFLNESQSPGFSRAEIQRLIVAGKITLNGNRVKSSVRVRSNDLVQVQSLPSRETSLEPEELPLSILYEDDDCIVINKAPGMVVHPAAGRTAGTLVNALLHHCPDLEGVGGVRRPGIVHRLDKDTSGVMIIAKNAFALQRLAHQFIDRSVTKEYLALVWGRIGPATGIVDRPIGRHRSDRKRMSSVHSLSRKRAAVTEWRVERYFPVAGGSGESVGLSLLRLIPRTGRTHQIRVHLADLGFPVVGDKVYGHKRKKTSIKSMKNPWLDLFPRQVLHAKKLALNHPRTGQRMEFSAPLPDDIRSLLKKLQRHSIDEEPLPGRVSAR